MRTILCTTGTSLAPGPPFHDPAVDPDGQQYHDRIRRRLEKLRGDGGEAYLRAASAESNSLREMGVSATDRVVLMHSETTDGRICAEEVRDLLERELGVKADLASITGLQINDVKRFRRVGIQNLFAELDRRCRPLQGLAGEEVILNATGGFKSTVSYLTLYGLLHRLPVVYLFERGTGLLTLPPVPIHFDYERLGRAADALGKLSEQGVMPREKFFAAIPGLDFHDRDRYESLLEEDETGAVTLSAFGMMLAEALGDERAQSEVYVSPSARAVYAASDGHVREQFTFMLERVHDPLWRQAKIHPIYNSGLTVYKPGNTAERIGCILHGRRVYVCELVDQHDYGRMEGRKAADYDLKTFSRWSLPPGEPAPPATEEEAFRRQAEALDRAQRQLRESEASLESVRRDYRAKMDALRAERDARFREVGELRVRVAEADGLRARLAEVEAECRELQGRVAGAQPGEGPLAEQSGPDPQVETVGPANRPDDALRPADEQSPP